MKKENLDFRNDDLDAVLGRTPIKVLKCGIIIPLSVVVVFIIGAFFYRYPDVIKAEACVSVVGDSCNCMLFVQAAGSGKIRNGQSVVIRIDNFPDTEYGYLSGLVDSIDGRPNDDGLYAVYVDLPKGVATDKGNDLSSMHVMKGHAEILLDDKYLADVFISPIKKLIDNRF